MPTTSSPAAATRVAPTAASAPSCPCADHFVQFYHHDDFLIESVSRYVADALSAGGVALVVATEAHLNALAARLEDSGLDLATLAGAERYVALDAPEMLAAIMRGDRPDREQFERHIGGLIRRLADGGEKLAVFGELVALLCADGKSAAAVELEELWNDLAEQNPFSLFCAYPMQQFAREDANRTFLRICSAHARVLPAEDYAANSSTDDLHRSVVLWQQKAAALEIEVAQRKRAEETLRRREAELTAFVETAPLGLHWVDEQGMILWANQAELELLGYDASEYIGRRIFEFHVDPGAMHAVLAQLRRGETVRGRQLQVRCKSGAIKTVEIDSTALWEEGRFVHTQCFTRDLTGQRSLEEASRHLAAIVECSDDAIISKDLNGFITSWNKGAQRIFGYAPEEVVGRPVTVLIPPERFDEEPRILAQLRRGERVEHFETQRRTKDGRLLDISLTISPIHDETGRIVGASKVARDISDKKRTAEALEDTRRDLARVNADLERRVEEKTASLREAVAQMEEFSYTVSHDLRAPLRSMQVYSESLLEDYGERLDGEAQHCLRRIAENATRLDKMVTDVLTFSRISRAELRMHAVDLDQLVRDVVQQYPALHSPRAQIEIGALARVRGHEPSLIQIVSNLLGNAVKFVAPGVTPRVRIWAEQDGAAIRLLIQDNGIGIKPERQARLFRMFERAHPDLPYEGTGVGLAIVRKAANRMGGDVGCKSDGIHGSLFWVQLQLPETDS